MASYRTGTGGRTWNPTEGQGGHPGPGATDVLVFVAALLAGIAAFSVLNSLVLTRPGMATAAKPRPTKELIALGISVAVRCDACIAFHAELAVRQGATRDEIMETMGMAIYTGAEPSVYVAQAVEAYDQFRAKADAGKV